jgi:rhodanese-related sulfurtransferase
MGTTDELKETTADHLLISPAEALGKVARGALLVDVRSSKTRALTGTVDGSVRGDRHILDEQFGLSSPVKLESVTGHDQDIVVFCGSTAGSGPVAEWLATHGYTHVSHVEGAFDALKDAGAPIVPVTDVPTEVPA